LRERSVPEPEANAELIMAEVLGIGRLQARLDSARVLTGPQASRFWSLVLERGRRIPLAYLLGHQAFMGLEIKVGREALIPRPETEQVVEEAIGLLAPRAQEPLHLLEIGTGSGCIAISLSKAFPHAVVYATEISSAALRLALRNAQDHRRAGRIRFIREDLFKAGGGRGGWADLVISNPPYVPSREIGRLEPELRHEPRLALDGGPDGLRAMRAVAPQAMAFLKPGGWVVLEIGARQGESVRRILKSAGFEDHEIRKDLQGLDRIALAQAPRQGEI